VEGLVLDDSGAATERLPLPSAQGREIGVTPEMLVAAAEQGSRDRSLVSQRDDRALPHHA
jgi:hypothetical protein